MAFTQGRLHDQEVEETQMKTKLPIRIGGLMRCCLETYYTAKLKTEKEGAVLHCKYCANSMRVSDGAWEWAPDIQLGVPRKRSVPAG